MPPRSEIDSSLRHFYLVDLSRYPLLLFPILPLSSLFPSFPLPSLPLLPFFVSKQICFTQTVHSKYFQVTKVRRLTIKVCGIGVCRCLCPEKVRAKFCKRSPTLLSYITIPMKRARERTYPWHSSCREKCQTYFEKSEALLFSRHRQRHRQELRSFWLKFGTFPQNDTNTSIVRETQKKHDPLLGAVAHE